MTTSVASLGYGYHLSESIVMLDFANENLAKPFVRAECVKNWPQASASNKEKMWNHLARRYFQFDDDRIVMTPFLKLYGGLTDMAEKLDLIFFQLCQSTPLILDVLRSLTKNTLLDTGSASFTKYHLDQLLQAHFGHVAKSTSERVRQILRESGRLRADGKNYIATSTCPCDAVLGFGLYCDAENFGWRSPSTATVVNQSDITATFLCNRPQLVSGLKRLSDGGHVEFHTLGNTDQVQLIHKSSQEFVDAWLR